MADIAEVLFKADTSELKQAVGDINNFNTSAKSAQNSADQLGVAIQKTSVNTAKETAEIKKNTVERNKNNAATKQQSRLRSIVLGENRKLERLATGVDPKTGKLARDLGVNRFNTANIAAQFQDIGVTAAMGMNPMTIALQQGTQLSAILNNMGDPIKGLAQAFSQLINPVALLSIGITGLIAGIIQMIDWSSVWKTTSGLLADGLDWLADNIDLVTVALGTFAALQVVTHLGAIGTAIVSLTTSVISLTKALYKTAVGWLVAMGPVGWVILGITAVSTAIYAFRKEIANLLGENVINAIKSGINTVIGWYLGAFKAIGAAGEWLFNKLKNLFNGGSEMGSFTEHVSDAFQSAQMDYVGKATTAIETGMTKISDVLHKGADALRNAGDDVSKKLKEAWDKIVKGIEGRKIEIGQEGDLVGRIGEDYFITKERYDLLNKAREAGITLTAEQTKYIEESAVSLGKEANALDLLNKRFDFAKSTTTSFFTDMNHALIEGQTLWEAFGNAVTNVLNKILDKITEVGIDYLFAAGKASGWFGSVGGAAAGAGTPAPVASALGTAWYHGIQKYATGGVVGSPTMFGTSSGLGLMGEAGPEAIMPLKRGSDGSLGVRADGIGGANVVVNVINNSNAKATVNQRQTSQGTEIDVMIDQLVADKLGTQGTASNTAMNNWNNRQLIAR